MGDQDAQGVFHKKFDFLSINSKELLAMYYGIKSLKDCIQGTTVLLHCDNTTAVSCIRKKGSRDPFCDTLTRKIFAFASQNNTTLNATFITRDSNSRVDRLSRTGCKNPRTKWALSQSTFAWITKRLLFLPDLDLFASSLNKKLPKYCSRARDPECFHVDVFTLNWSKYKGFAFPPFSLLDRCLLKLDEDCVENIAMVVPLWPSAPFFGTIVRHFKSMLLLIPRHLSQELHLPCEMDTPHAVAHLRLVLTHLSASCFAPRKCHKTWLPTLLTTGTGQLQ